MTLSPTMNPGRIVPMIDHLRHPQLTDTACHHRGHHQTHIKTQMTFRAQERCKCPRLPIFHLMYEVRYRLLSETSNPTTNLKPPYLHHSQPKATLTRFIRSQATVHLSHPREATHFLDLAVTGRTTSHRLLEATIPSQRRRTRC